VAAPLPNPADRLYKSIVALDRRVPRPPKPKPEDEDAYWEGVRHGFHTALRWAEEISRGARDSADASGLRMLATYLDFVDVFNKELDADESPHVLFDDDRPPPSA